MCHNYRKGWKGREGKGGVGPTPPRACVGRVGGRVGAGCGVIPHTHQERATALQRRQISAYLNPVREKKKNNDEEVFLFGWRASFTLSSSRHFLYITPPLRLDRSTDRRSTVIASSTHTPKLHLTPSMHIPYTTLHKSHRAKHPRPFWVGRLGGITSVH